MLALGIVIAASVAGLVVPTTASATLARVDGGGLRGHLNDVAVLGPDEAWAVGNGYHLGHLTPRVEHWDGTSWTSVDVPPEPGHDVRFIGVAGSSPNDVWATGAYIRHWRFYSFADHWDGASWTTASFPNVSQSPFGSLVQDLSVDSPTDAWVTGMIAGSRPWVVRWDGTEWDRIPLRTLAQDGTPIQVLGVTALSSSDAWISGEVSTHVRVTETLVAHWNGDSWTRMETPSVPNRSNSLTSIAALGDDDIWAAGVTTDNKTGAGKPLLLHWDGTTWTRDTLPKTGRYSEFLDVSASAANDAWAVGDTGLHALAMHWDGSSWTIASPALPAASLAGVADFSPSLALAVGAYRNGTALHDIWNGASWQ
jgi:hypothetical protein